MQRSRHSRSGQMNLWIMVLAVFVTLWACLLIVRRHRAGIDEQGEEPERAVVDTAMLRELEGAALKPTEEPASTTDDWPQWRGPLRDGLSTAPMGTDWPADGPPVLWRVRAGAGYSCVAVVGQRVLTLEQDGEDEIVVCRNAQTGGDEWRFRYRRQEADKAGYKGDHGTGPRSTPTVNGNLVYTVGSAGLFHCLKLQTGEQVWRHDLLKEFNAPNLQWGTSFSPLVEGDLVLTNPGGRHGGSLAAFDKRTGSLVWKSGDDPAGYSSPIAATVSGVRQVLFFTGTRLVSVSPATGTGILELWLAHLRRVQHRDAHRGRRLLFHLLQLRPGVRSAEGVGGRRWCAEREARVRQQPDAQSLFDVRSLSGSSLWL